MAKRLPAVAGQFYPEGRDELERLLSRFGKVPLPESYRELSSSAELMGAILPHAGYSYSGGIAANGVRALAANSSSIKTLVVLCPAHRLAFYGMALSSADAFVTPLGDVKVNRSLGDKLQECEAVAVLDRAHQREHAIEVLLPMLRFWLPKITVVPIVVGDSAPATVAALLARVWLQPSTAVIFSTDLSHFLPYEQARQRDANTCHQLRRLEGLLTGEQACGCRSLNGLLQLSKTLPMRCEPLEYCNSGDTAGGKDRVVGYASFAIHRR